VKRYEKRCTQAGDSSPEKSRLWPASSESAFETRMQEREPGVKQNSRAEKLDGSKPLEREPWWIEPEWKRSTYESGKQGCSPVAVTGEIEKPESCFVLISFFSN